MARCKPGRSRTHRAGTLRSPRMSTACSAPCIGRCAAASTPAPGSPTKARCSERSTGPITTAPRGGATSGGFRDRLEGWVPAASAPHLHNRVHVFVGGDMLVSSSPTTPFSSSTTATSTASGRPGRNSGPLSRTVRPRPPRRASSATGSRTRCTRSSRPGRTGRTRSRCSTSAASTGTGVSRSRSQNTEARRGRMRTA
jgi:hypothetical protein